MDTPLQDPSPDALARAIEQNGFQFFRLYRHWPRAEVYEGPDLLWTLTDIPFLVFNSVADARLERDTADAAIKAAIARCQSRRVPMLWTTGPSTRPNDLGERLVARGFIHTEDEPQMAMDLDELDVDPETPEGLEIEVVRDSSALARWCWVCNAGFGMPAFTERAWLDLYSCIAEVPHTPLSHFLGRLQGEPVATSSLLLLGGVAGVGGVATLPDRRGRGIGRAMTLAALRVGRAAGYRFGVLGASEMGVGLYRRIGFCEVCRFGSYIWMPGNECANQRCSD